jgi:ABC-2 type transport system permease protein
MNAVYVLWIRQLKRYSRSRARIVGSLGQPLLFLVALGFGFGPIFRRAGAGNYLQFLAPGVIGMTILFSAVFSGIELIWDRQFGFLKETLVAPVPRMMIMIGRTCGGATVSLMQGLIVVAICYVAGFRAASFASWPFAFVFMALIAIMFTAFGTAIASVLSDFQGVSAGDELPDHAAFFPVGRTISAERRSSRLANCRGSESVRLWCRRHARGVRR